MEVSLSDYYEPGCEGKCLKLDIISYVLKSDVEVKSGAAPSLALHVFRVCLQKVCQSD